MRYRVSFRASADRSLDRLPRPIQARIIDKAVALGDSPRPPGAVKLAGTSGLWRVRIGDYRMVYLIDDQRRTVDIRVVAHRREVYRGMWGSGILADSMVAGNIRANCRAESPNPRMANFWPLLRFTPRTDGGEDGSASWPGIVWPWRSPARHVPTIPRPPTPGR